MKNLYYVILASLLAVFLTACASVDYSHKAEFPQAKSDQALIYFYRTPGFIGSTYRFDVSEGDRVVGAMAQDSYFYLFTSAGEHTYGVYDQYEQQGSEIMMNVQEGKVYYVRVDVNYQAFGGEAVFTLVEREQAMTLLPSRKYVLPLVGTSSNDNIPTE